MLVLRSVSKRYQDKIVLREVTMSVERGRCVCVAGGNAEGKTTLLNIAASFLRPDSGRVEGDGTLGYVMQNTAMVMDLSVRDNLLLWYSAHKRRSKEMFLPESPEGQLGLLPVARKRVGKLSGGYQKRLSIAAAMAGKPDYLLLDEPFAALDMHSREDVMGLLRRFVHLGGGVLLSSHDPVAVAQLADEVFFLRGGDIGETLHLARDDSPEARARVVLDAFYRMS